MPKSSEGYLYRVGWLGVEVNEGAPDGVRETLHVLGDYKGQTPKAAMEAAVADFPRTGGIPRMEGQRMVAVVRSKWYEFDAGAHQETIWTITEVKDGMPPAADPDPPEGASS